MNLLKSLAATIFMAVSIATPARAKDYIPTTSWPYIYEDFQEGCVTNLRGIEIHHKQLNISLIQGDAHYLQDGKVMKVDMMTVSTITIGKDKYMPASGRLVKILNETEHGITALSTAVDFNAMEKREEGTGYGGGSAISTSWRISTSSIEGTVGSTPQNISEISKNGGKDLILKKRRGIVYNRKFIPALKHEILNISGIDEDKVKKYMKDNKIRLSDDEDLSLLAEFIGTLQP